MSVYNSLTFKCPKCGMNVKHNYHYTEFDDYQHDSLMLCCGALWCGNCANGVDASKDDYGSVVAPTRDDDDGELFATGHA